MEERPVDRLARIIISVLSIALVAVLCWYFRSVLVYLIVAAVVALVGSPVYRFVSKLKFFRKPLPDSINAVLTLLFILLCVIGLASLVFPVVGNVLSDISKANVETMTKAISVPLYSFNERLIKLFPGLGYNFRIETYVLDQVQNIFSVSIFSSMVGSLASFLASLAVSIFAVVFISFFFIRNPNLFKNMIVAFVPDRLEQKTRESLGEVEHLISRYFIGLITEILGVSILNFLGLFLVARMGFRYSIGIAFMTGLLNVVPYVGPLVGGIIGVSLSLVIKYACATSFGLAVSFPVFLAVLIGIFVFTQLVDNYVYQPFIYSNSIKAHPLEIFIVLLLAGHIGGILGMLVAIPGYTVIRVFATKFYGHKKAIRMLTGNNTYE